MNAFKCPKCNSTTWGNNDFCPECGQPLQKKCVECGFSVRHVFADKYKFCPKCGGEMEY